MSMFIKAVKQSAKLRMAITGPSGSGKTYTALAIATGLAAGKPIAVVDTEHGSASKYADLWQFDVAEMHAPFHPDKFIAALRDAEAAGYAVVVLDSISHAWSGTGGVLDIVDEAAKRSKSGNTYTAWKEGTPVQQRMIDAIVQSGIHVIATMRSKTEYILADTGNGKQAPRKVGMAPVQRDQFEYEFDVVLDMDVDNNAIVSKSRCPALSGRVFPKPGADVAGILRTWLEGAPAPVSTPTPAPAQPRTVQHTAPAPSAPQPAPQPPTEATEQGDEERGTVETLITPEILKQLNVLGSKLYGNDWDDKRHALVEHITKGATKSSKELTVSEAQLLIAGMERKRAAQPQAVAA